MKVSNITAWVKKKLTGIVHVFKTKQMIHKKHILHKHSCFILIKKEWSKLIIPKRSYVYFNKGTLFACCPWNTWQNQCKVCNLAVYLPKVNQLSFLRLDDIKIDANLPFPACFKWPPWRSVCAEDFWPYPLCGFEAVVDLLVADLWSKCTFYNSFKDTQWMRSKSSAHTDLQEDH